MFYEALSSSSGDLETLLMGKRKKNHKTDNVALVLYSYFFPSVLTLLDTT